MVDSPATLVTTEYGWSANMQRIMKAQVLRDGQMSSFMVGKKKMEINPEHVICKELRNKFESNESDRTVKDLVNLLFETASLTSGLSLDDDAEEEEAEAETKDEELPELDGEDMNDM